MKTDITVVLDRSGSMSDCVTDTVGGFNTFLAEQKKTGNCCLTLVQFDNQYQVDYNGVPIEEVKPLIAGVNYTPRGSTALYDAAGRAIYAAKERIHAPRLRCSCCDGDVPKVIFVIQTDGYENASREFTAHAVKEMIQHQRSKHDWQFVFMGADVDAMVASAGMGIHHAHTMGYGKAASGVAFNEMSRGINKYKSSGARGMSADVNFFEKEDDDAVDGAETTTTEAVVD